MTSIINRHMKGGAHTHSILSNSIIHYQYPITNGCDTLQHVSDGTLVWFRLASITAGHQDRDALGALALRRVPRRAVLRSGEDPRLIPCSGEFGDAPDALELRRAELRASYSALSNTPLRGVGPDPRVGDCSAAAAILRIERGAPAEAVEPPSDLVDLLGDTGPASP